ncbi:hypothetical protein ACP4OV_011845 [Aristida adscensionis]
MLEGHIQTRPMVVVGLYTAPRYRRHPVIGVLFLGASTLFIPIMSHVAATVANLQFLFDSVLGKLVAVSCKQIKHRILFLLWTGLVVVVGINTSVVVAGDAREARNIGLSVDLLIKTLWAAYLILSTIPVASFHSTRTIFYQLLTIMFTKLVFKVMVSGAARRSFAFGNSPAFIAGYMAQLPQAESNHLQQGDDHSVPPPLVVMGEENITVKGQRHRNNFRSNTGLVTLDRVWLFCETYMWLHGAKDLCFSFALFKLLRCRFAKYTVGEAGCMEAHRFFRDILLNRSDDHQRVFRVITDELSFIHDYYYSSLPTYYSHHLFPLFNIALSLYTIGYCLFLTVLFLSDLVDLKQPQIYCHLWCSHSSSVYLHLGGSLLYDSVPMYLIIAVLVLAETRDIVSCICSNWTKVALIYHLIKQSSWRQSTAVQKCISWLLKCHRCWLLNNWNDKMKQCSVLAVHPKKKPLVFLRRLLRLHDPMKNVKVPHEVKDAIFKGIREIHLANQWAEFPKSTFSYLLIWLEAARPSSIIPHMAFIDNSTHPGHTMTMLVWHIATSIFEGRHTQTSDSDERHKVVATHLSCYCAYLVACCPELLPDDDKWCKSLYDDVKKDTNRLLHAVGADPYKQQDELQEHEYHQVLKDGVSLGVQLLEQTSWSWQALAHFWVEMILYVAPSENMEGHLEAIARGGELITLVWALLTHAGITDR